MPTRCSLDCSCPVCIAGDVVSDNQLLMDMLEEGVESVEFLLAGPCETRRVEVVYGNNADSLRVRPRRRAVGQPVRLWRWLVVRTHSAHISGS